MAERANQNNAYFEQQVRAMYSALPEEDVVRRISDCSLVADRLNSDPVWKLVIGDAEQWVSHLDKNWQDIREEEKLNAARVLKFAYMHLVNLPEKYKQDLENAQAELNRRKDTSKATPKDYDLETTIES